MPMPSATWLCRVCEHSNTGAVEVCTACGCPLAAGETEIAARLAAREPLPLEPRPVSLKLILAAATAWLALLVVVWLTRERMSFSHLGAWLSGVYLLRYLLLRWHRRPAQLGAASINGELSSLWRSAIDIAVTLLLAAAVWFLFSAQAPQ